MKRASRAAVLSALAVAAAAARCQGPDVMADAAIGEARLAAIETALARTEAALAEIERRVAGLAERPPGPPAEAPGAAGEWVGIESPCYRVLHAPGGAEDGHRVMAWLDQAREALARELAVVPLGDLLRDVDCRVWVHPAPAEGAAEGAARTGITTDGAAVRADMHVLAPSAHRGAGTTLVGEPFDAVYHQKTIVHEYAHVVLYRIVGTRRRGWGLWTAPGWFREGYAEYLALVCGAERTRTVTMERYRAVVRAAPERVRPDLSVENEYLDGAMLLRCLHESFGRERVQALLVSEAATFDEALGEALGGDRRTVYDRWREWVGE